MSQGSLKLQNQSNLTGDIKKPKLKKVNSWRLAIQLIFFSIIASVALGQWLESQGMAVSWLSTACLHAICPFGGVVSIYQLVTAGTIVQKVDQSAFILMYVAFALAIVAGPAFCGWICPFGSFQEWLGSLGRKIFRKRFNNFIPPRVDHYLRYFRYAVLALVIYGTAASASLVFSHYDPYEALFKFWGGETTLSAFIVLGAVIALALFIERPFCKYACPYGALLGLFNLFRIFQLRRSEANCIDCKSCDRVCPMNITVSEGKLIRDHQCISCLKCTSEFSCPVAGTVALSTAKL
jgi:polyferredoxin